MKSWPQVSQRALALILSQIAGTGTAPSLVQLRNELGCCSIEAIQDILSEMASQRLIYRKSGSDNILAAYPLSVAPTAHQVRLADGRRVYAMCAVDAFGVAFLFRQDIAISSLCHHCQIGVEVKVVGERISFASPASTVVWYTPEVACCIAAERQCPSINFFWCREHLEAWRCEQQEHLGQVFSLEQAFDRARVVFDPVMMLGREGGLQ